MAFLTSKPQSSFSGYPETRLRKDWRGREWYVVDIRYLSPFGAKAGDNLGNLAAFGLFCGAIAALSDNNVTLWWTWLASLIAPFALIDLWRAMFRKLLRRHQRVALSRELIRIRGKAYDRHKVLGFSADHHNQFLEEQERITHRRQLAQRSKGKPSRIRLYYGEETRVLFCEFADNRVEICTIFGLKDRQAIHARLNRINDALNGELGAGIGAPISTTADSPKGRGGIPE